MCGGRRRGDLLTAGTISHDDARDCCFIRTRAHDACVDAVHRDGLCSWLSFVDRQIFAVLSPTILRDTGMSTQDFGDLAFDFFLSQVIGTPLWGSILSVLSAGLREAVTASHVARAAYGDGARD